MVLRGLREGVGLKRKGLVTTYLRPEVKEAFIKLCKRERVTMSSYLENMVYQAVVQNQLLDPSVLDDPEDTES